MPGAAGAQWAARARWLRSFPARLEPGELRKLPEDPVEVGAGPTPDDRGAEASAGLR